MERIKAGFSPQETRSQVGTIWLYICYSSPEKESDSLFDFTIFMRSWLSQETLIFLEGLKEKKNIFFKYLPSSVLKNMIKKVDHYGYVMIIQPKNIYTYFLISHIFP